MIGSQMTRVSLSIRLWRDPSLAAVHLPLPTVVAIITGSRIMPKNLLVAHVLDADEPSFRTDLSIPVGDDHLYVFASGAPTVTMVMLRTEEGTHPAEQIDRTPPCWRLL